jgi:hypothetical protein
MNKESSTQTMKPTVVSSYVRGVHLDEQEVNEHDNTVNIMTARIVVIALAVILWKVTVPALMFVGAAYGVKVLAWQPAPQKTVEAVTEPVDKPKRHYEHRLKVTHYETGKTVRV